MHQKRIVSFFLVIMLIVMSAMTAFAASSSTVTTADDRASAIVNAYTSIDKKDFDKKAMVKIPSNAHKFDAAGLVFEWVAKQKDDGYLVVSPEVFEVFESFKIFVKCSNEYMYKTITAPGTYLIEQFEANGKIKNINMVWIGDFVLKQQNQEYFLKVISNTTAYENGDGVGVTQYELADLAYVAEFILTEKGYAVESSTGKYLQDVWSSIWQQDPILQALLPQYIWSSYSTQNPVSGDLVKFVTPFTVKGNTVTSVDPLKVAADNAYIVFVNGRYVGCSSFLTGQYTLSYEDANEVRRVFGNLKYDIVKDQGWRQAGTFNIGSLVHVGSNVITVYAANEYYDVDDRVEDPNIPWSVYHDEAGNSMNNPATMIFGFTVSSKD